MDYLLAREPVFDSGGTLYAYEIKYKRLESSGEASGDPAEFFGIDLRRICGGAKAFVEFSRDMIKSGMLSAFSPDLIVAVISGRDIADDRRAVEVCRKLKRKGYLFAIDDFKRGRGFDDLLELCEFVMIDFGSLHTAQDSASYICGFTSKRIVAKNVGSREKFDYVKKLGCAFAEGDFFLKPQRDLRNIQPLPISIVRAMNIMMKPEPDVDEIVEVLSHDTAVCQKILRLINSAYFGVTNKISSIGQAIIVLGFDYLREWIYMLAMQHIYQNENSELMRLSLVTAKFCRKLANEIPDAKNDAEAFYLMGLMSILVFSGERVILSVLGELPLTDDIKNGILRRDGVYGDVFGMAVDYAGEKWDSFEETAKIRGIEPEKAAEMYAEALEEADATDLG